MRFHIKQISIATIQTAIFCRQGESSSFSLYVMTVDACKNYHARVRNMYQVAEGSQYKNILTYKRTNTYKQGD